MKQETPQSILINAMVHGTDATIRMQEAAGQAELVALQSVLPAMGTVQPDYHGDSYRDPLEALGFLFGEMDDDLFIKATFPPGWRIQATEHSMHSNLLDARGCKRGGIFYKAAFYDRSAYFYPVPRLSLERGYLHGGRVLTTTEYYAATSESGRDDEGRQVCVIVQDSQSGARLYQSSSVSRGDYVGVNALVDQGKKWLNIHYPLWEDAFAYWEAPVVS